MKVSRVSTFCDENDSVSAKLVDKMTLWNTETANYSN